MADFLSSSPRTPPSIGSASPIGEGSESRSPAGRSMCGGPERIKPSPSPSPEEARSSSPAKPMNHLTVETDDSFSTLLELAANNDAEAFRRSLDRDPSAVDEAGMWYGRKKGTNLMVLLHRTPLMVAATYGSLDVLRLILSLSVVDVNRGCGPDNATALHCAASGGALNAVDAVKILLAAGADPNAVDASGHRPADVIVVPPKSTDVKVVLEQLLGGSGCVAGGEEQQQRVLRVTTSSNSNSNSNSPPLSSSPVEDGFPSSNLSSSPTDPPPPAVSEKKEYPIDPSLPDIKNSIYATDEFRMYSFKVRPCSRAYSHDWTECPFVHPGENARRRDPRKYHYSCVPCPEFRKGGACRRGDMCEYAHGVFECWLHPAQYRTRLCKDGTSCTRRVCFFAHTNEELRPLYMSTGSAVPSPRSATSAAMEMAAAMGLMPGSPSSVSAMMSPFTPPMSPSTNGMAHSSLCWPQPNASTLPLAGINLQSSRLRSSLSARDMPVDDFSMMPDFNGQQLFHDLCYSRFASVPAGRSKVLAPSNLDELFSAEISSSPRYSSGQGSVFSPSHKTAILNQFQQQQHSMLSPINTNMFSQKAGDHQQLPGHSSLLRASLGAPSPGRMSPRGDEPLSPMSARLAVFAQREKQQQTLRSLSSRHLGSGTSPIVGTPVNSSWYKWALPSGTLDWGVNGEELGRLRRSSSFELRSGGEEPDLSWVHSLTKESPPEKIVTAAMTSVGPSATVPSGGGGDGDASNANPQIDGHDQSAVLSAWLEQMQLDQTVA
ncbi:zinc finger CCCH domain-containing protein 24 [Phoenix dactylifera]|uniref:Zinc finger CCCH domain-containing protein 24 n=1 Tax=Phoenix dactylifera TaxID=42345 RepID=A0A8B7CM52_PHODC|nr:zinc finger CCCH domain-containing protein 24 [Phoenix dactylifera]